MAVRKIDLMHRLFGKTDGKICKDCFNLYKRVWDKTYYKCTVYGDSASEATDWRLKYPACGLFNKDWRCGGEIVRLVKPERAVESEEKPLDGQIEMWGLDNGK